MTPTGCDPEQYASAGRFVDQLGAPLVDLLAPQPGERVVALGCGDGGLTSALVAAGADASAQMVAAVAARRHVTRGAWTRGRCGSARG